MSSRDLLPQHWDFEYSPPGLAFLHTGSGDPTQGLLLQSKHFTDRPFSPVHCTCIVSLHLVNRRMYFQSAATVQPSDGVSSSECLLPFPGISHCAYVLLRLKGGALFIAAPPHTH